MTEHNNDDLFGFAPPQPPPPSGGEPQMPIYQDPRMQKSEDYEQAKKKDTVKRVLIIVLSVFIVVFTFLIGYISSSWFEKKDIKALKWAYDMIDKYYIGDTVDGVGPYTRADYVSRGLSLLDKYSRLLTPEEVSAFYSSAEGNEDGYGISYEVREVAINGDTKPYAVALSVAKGSPSYGKIYEGDVFYKINDVEVTVYEDGTASFPVTGIGAEKFTLYRPYYENEEIVYKLIETSVTSGTFTASYVTYVDSDMTDIAPSQLGTDTAYIKFEQFNEPADVEFAAYMQEMSREGRKNVILDMRNNPGGFLPVCQEISSYFIGSNVPLFHVAYKDKSRETTQTLPVQYQIDFEKVVVLVNGSSASASEVMLAAMLAYDAVDLIIGETTYGKGIGQSTMIDRGSGYGITLTSMRWYSPDNVSIHKIGIPPTSGYEMKNDGTNYPYSYSGDKELNRALAYINA